MLSRFNAWPVFLKIVVAIAGILILVSGIIWAFILLHKKEIPTTSQNPPIQFEYCQASPNKLCILSFGRGGPDTSLINFFVPKKNFPDFYLLVRRADTESRFECVRNSEIKTSVLCSGAPLSLKQSVKIDILASEDDRLLATGTFFIQAFLVSTLSVQSTDIAARETQSPVSEQTPGSATPRTPTPGSSTTAYPNSSYP